MSARRRSCATPRIAGPGPNPTVTRIRPTSTSTCSRRRRGRWGRRLVDTLIGALRERGVTGVHLVASAENAGALAFYRRLGFTPLPSHDGVQAFAIDLADR